MLNLYQQKHASEPGKSFIESYRDQQLSTGPVKEINAEWATMIIIMGKRSHSEIFVRTQFFRMSQVIEKFCWTRLKHSSPQFNGTHKWEKKKSIDYLIETRFSYKRSKRSKAKNTTFKPHIVHRTKQNFTGSLLRLFQLFKRGPKLPWGYQELYKSLTA